MIRMYCHGVHGEAASLPAAALAAGSGAAAQTPSLCPDCAALLEYTLARVDACSFGGEKPVCSRCTVHCFRPAMRDRIRAAMRYSGPRMAYHHPYLAVRHLLDRKRTPVR
jgi:hypothetical protein